MNIAACIKKFDGFNNPCKLYIGMDFCFQVKLAAGSSDTFISVYSNADHRRR